MQHRGSRSLDVVALGLVAAITSHACSEGSATVVESGTTPGASPSDAPPTEPPPATQPTTEPTPSSTAATLDEVLVELDGDQDPTGTRWLLPALGGVEFVVPDGHRVHHDGDMVLIRPTWKRDEGRYLPSMVVALVSQIGSTGEIPTAESLTGAAIEGVGSAEPTGTRIELLGRTLSGYRFEADADQSVGPHYLFPALPRPVFGPSNWQPFPLATLYLADTDFGVLAVGAVGTTEDELAEASAIFEAVAPTIEVDALRSRAPEPPQHPDPVAPPAPVAAPPGAPPTLDAITQPVAAGEYSLPFLGTPMSVEVPPGWWVQPNVPGWTVLTGDESFGPGDRGISFRTGLDHIVAVSTDYEPIGPPLRIPADGPWPASELPTLVLGATTELELDGVPARRFDVEVDVDATCASDEPCEYQLLSTHIPVPESLRKGYASRIWSLDEGVAEPVTIVATAADEAWLDEAEAVVASIRFDW